MNNIKKYLDLNYKYDSLENYIGDICKIIVKNKNTIMDEIKLNNNFKFNDVKYNKVKLDNLSNDIYEINVIFWLKNQKTPIHDHSSNGCLLHLLEGKLEQNIYDENLKIINKNIIDIDNLDYITNQIGFHDIIALENSISIHIYSPSNHIAKIFK